MRHGRMYKHRLKAKIDNNQNEIVDALRQIPGVQVEPGHDDIFVGYKGRNYWFEIKSGNAVNKAGHIRESAIKPKQKELREHWSGHYSIVSSFDQIILELGII